MHMVTSIPHVTRILASHSQCVWWVRRVRLGYNVGSMRP
jgi:hypothetical protein